MTKTSTPRTAEPRTDHATLDDVVRVEDGLERGALVDWSGLTERRVSHWHSLGYIGGVAVPGRGHRITYPWRECFKARALRILTDGGLATADGARILDRWQSFGASLVIAGLAEVAGDPMVCSNCEAPIDYKRSAPHWIHTGSRLRECSLDGTLAEVLPGGAQS